MGKELSKRQLRIVFSYVLPYSFVIGGGLLAFWSMCQVVSAKDSVNWPCAEGRIVSSSVRESTSSGGGKGSPPKTSYHAEVEYTFSVGDVAYRGSRVAYADYDDSSHHANGVVKRYPKGQAVSVYYRPGKPGECVLEPGLGERGVWDVWTLPILSSFFFVCGCAMAIFIPVAMKRPSVRHYYYD